MSNAAVSVLSDCENGGNLLSLMVTVSTDPYGACNYCVLRMMDQIQLSRSNILLNVCSRLALCVRMHMLSSELINRDHDLRVTSNGCVYAISLSVCVYPPLPLPCRCPCIRRCTAFVGHVTENGCVIILCARICDSPGDDGLLPGDYRQERAESTCIRSH